MPRPRATAESAAAPSPARAPAARSRVEYRLLATVAFAALVALLPLSARTPRASQDPPPARVTDGAKITIPNFGRLNANYYRGGQPKDRDYPVLARLGIRTVLSLQPSRDNEREAELVEGAGMTFQRIPLSSDEAPTMAQVEQFLSVVTNPDLQPVFVHCSGGRHRTGAMTAVYRIRVDGWSADQAYQEMKRYKFGWSVLHRALKNFVYRYGRDVHGP